MPSQEVLSKVRSLSGRARARLVPAPSCRADPRLPLPLSQPDGAVFTTSQGHPVPEPYAHQRAGRNGPLLLQDFAHIDMLAHFDRERIPERVVHAKGSGAHGTFEVTDPIPDLTCAEFLGKKGKVSATARFSTVGGESGSADTARDPRGFSVKLRTEQGIWDHVYVRLLSLRLLCGGRGEGAVGVVSSPKLTFCLPPSSLSSLSPSFAFAAALAVFVRRTTRRSSS